MNTENTPSDSPKKETSTASRIAKYIWMVCGGVFALIVLATIFSDDSDKSATSTESGLSATEDSVKTDPIPRLKRELASAKTFKNKAFRGSVTSLQLELALFNVWAKLAKEALLSGDKEQMKLGAQLKEQSKKIQAREFPLLRKAFIASMKDKLWENNIYVQPLGSTNSTMELVGGVFANNRNIKETQETLYENLMLFRFKRVHYKWIKHDEEYTYYEVKSMADSQVSEKVM